MANNVVGELSKAMADPNPEVAVEIIGALRYALYRIIQFINMGEKKQKKERIVKALESKL